MDSSVYGALVRIAQPWVMRYPLLDFHGNMGNICGDGPAAYRYTEARLSKLVEEGMLNGLKKNMVDYMPTFDESGEEPVTLPSIFPNLLCNPNTGIGVAIACHWAPHNLREVAQAIYDYIDGKEPSIPGPDFPTGGVIINGNDLPAIIKSGRGTVRIRGKYKIEKNKIIFTEIPYEQTVEGILQSISEVCEAQEIVGIEDARDESNKKGLRIVITCEKGVSPESIVAKLFAKTALQSTISYNQVALVNKTPTELGLKDCLKIYVEHNIECFTKEFNYELIKAKARAEIVDGLLKALEDIDNIIALIKASKSSANAKDELIAKYKFSEVQAKAIIDMKLGRLAGLERIELQTESEDLAKSIEELTALLSSTDRIKETIKIRLAEIVKKYGDDRRTEITHIEITKEDKEKVEITPEDCFIMVSESGIIKRIPTKSYRTQKRGGVGIKNNDDITKFSCKTNTVDTLMVFSSKGKMYRIGVNNIPEGTNATKGVGIQTLIPFEPNETPMAYACLHQDSPAKFVFFATKKGIIKRVPIDEYSKMKRTGIVALALREGDSLAAVTFINEEEMMLISKKGMSIRFASKEMPISSRVAQGVKGFGLAEDDEVITCLPIKHTSDYLASFTIDGSAKKTPLTDFTSQGRGGKGLACSETELAAALLLDETDEALVIGDKTSIRISAKDIPNLSRKSIGNSIIKNNKKIVSVSKIS